MEKLNNRKSACCASFEGESEKWRKHARVVVMEYRVYRLYRHSLVIIVKILAVAVANVIVAVFLY